MEKPGRPATTPRPRTTTAVPTSINERAADHRWIEAKYETADEKVFYIGMRAITDDRRDLLVYPWQAPRIMALREATPEEPGDVVKIRNFTTLSNTITNFEDRVLADLAERIRELDDPDAVLVREDGVLNEILGRQRTPEMQQIVQTIQAAQSKLIRTPKDSLLVIQGGPGTGKTAVALHRVSWLLYNHGPATKQEDVLSPSDVLVIGPNPTFTRYIKQVLPELGDQDVKQIDINGLLAAGVRATLKEEPDVARVKGDERMLEIISQGLRDRIRPLRDGVRLTVEGFPWVVEIESGDTKDLVDEIGYLHYNQGRSRLREALLDLASVRASRRIKKDRSVYRGDTRLLFQQSEIDALVERVWPQLSSQAFLRDLFGSLTRLVSAAPSGFPVDQLQLLQRAPAPRLSGERWSKEDLVLLDAVQSELGGEPRDYGHIVVDEAQDLSPMQLNAIRRRSRNGAMTIVGDIAQSTGYWSRNSWEDVIEVLASPLPVYREALNHGYRVPRSVMHLARKLLSDADAATIPEIIVRDVEPGPGFHEVPEEEDLADVVLEVVKSHSARGHFVGVVCPDNRRPAIEMAFDSAGIMWVDADDGGLSAAINIVSPPAAKGLEFDAVVVVDPASIVDSGPQGDRMLYIAMTRTTHYLDLIHPAGTLSHVVSFDGRLSGVAAEAQGIERDGRAASAPVAGQESDERPARDTGETPDEFPSQGMSTEQSKPVSGGATGHDRNTEGARSNRAVRFFAGEIVSDLRANVGPQLWRPVLEEALRQLAEQGSA